MSKTIEVFKAKWIDFVDVTANTKTKKFLVRNREYNSIIGEIKWYGGFRKYSFFPNPNTIYEAQCLADILRFLNQLMLERKGVVVEKKKDMVWIAALDSDSFNYLTKQETKKDADDHHLKWFETEAEAQVHCDHLNSL